MGDLEYFCDELARYGIEVDSKLERRISRLIKIGYTIPEIARGIHPDFRWDVEHGRLDDRRAL